jgi:hypothetical protein
MALVYIYGTPFKQGEFLERGTDVEKSDEIKAIEKEIAGYDKEIKRTKDKAHEILGVDYDAAIALNRNASLIDARRLLAPDKLTAAYNELRAPEIAKRQELLKAASESAVKKAQARLKKIIAELEAVEAITADFNKEAARLEASEIWDITYGIDRTGMEVKEMIGAFEKTVESMESVPGAIESSFNSRWKNPAYYRQLFTDLK